MHCFVNLGNGILVDEQIEKQEQNSDDVHHFFLKILDVYVSQLRSGSGCPRNVIPIYVYQNHLLGYTLTVR